jgi:hypothetical protein
MSYNGSGTFNINTTGQPVVAGTVISSSAFNALTTDLATGLTTAITKDGQTTTTARITFAQGVTSSLVTDSSSVSTGSIITGGGVGIAKALYVGTTANVAGAVTLGGIATFSAQPIFSSLTASSAVATDASKGLVSVTNTGTGNNVLATSPTITTPTISSLSSAAATALTLQSAGTTAITVSTAQNVGIGTTAPNKPLSVYGGDGYIQMLNASTGTGNTDGAFIGVEGGTTSLRIVNQENDVISFSTNGLANERMRIDASGNVGIGITPTQKLDVKGNQRLVGDSAYILWRDTADSASSGVIQFPSASVATIGTYVNQAMSFQTNNTERMRISSGGLVSVGTTSGIAKMGVVFDGASDNGCVLRTSTNASGTGFLYFQQDTNTCGSVIRVGTTSAVTYNSTSDHRLKENAIPLTNALETINKLKPITFNWIEDKSSAVGFLAHEFQEVIPLSVTGEKDAVDADGNPIYQQMDNSGSIPYLVKAIQELKAINDSLTARIVALEAK